MSPYKFLPASLPIRKPPKASLISDFQNSLDKEFYTSSDWHTIERETPYGSSTYTNVDVRINRLLDAKTTNVIGDDYKRLLFKDVSDTPGLGSMFRFENSYWIVTNVERVKNIAGTCVVRRCNNVLRWKDFDTGHIYEQPCVLDYLLKENRDFSTGGSGIVQPSGFIDCQVQFNEKTNRIRPNRRFIFGNQSNWQALRLSGGGLNNYTNQVTYNNMSVGIIRMSLYASQINNQTDDLINGIADVGDYVYTIELNKNSLSLAQTESFTLLATVRLNGSVVTEEMEWSSSNPLIASVSSSGVVTGVATTGTAAITCRIKGNPFVEETCSVSITETPDDNYEIRISPNMFDVYEGEEQVYEVFLYENGVLLPDTFIFTVNPGSIPFSHYRYDILSGNSFYIKNIKKYSGDNIIFTATSGTNTKQFSISLKGAW